MLVFAHSRSLSAKFSGGGQPLTRVDLAAAQTSGRAGPTADAIDAVHCKRISIQNKPTRKGTLIPTTAIFDSSTARSAWVLGNLAAGAPASGQANFAELWDCPVVVADLINNNMNTNWCPHV
jgi:hypothetical protein